MNTKEALTRIKTGNFNGGYGLDLQLLVDAVGVLGDMLKSGQISEVVRCKNCKFNDCCSKHGGKVPKDKMDWFCADGERR